MAASADNRILGLSPKARRFVLPFIAVAVAVVLVGTITNRLAQDDGDNGPVVGGDLHALGELGSRTFVSGHAGAGYRTAAGGWTQIDTLDDKDVMGWAKSGSTLLAGGHAGLYRSADSGSTFEQVAGLPISDVHALGARGRRVYLGSPEAGVLVSNDGGTSFTTVGPTGKDFMGNIWIDPNEPDTAIAPSMQAGAVKTTDGGATWKPLGSSSGSMAVAVDGSGQQLAAIGMDGAEVSADGGRTWKPIDVPNGTRAAAYTAEGALIVAVLIDQRAEVYWSVDGKWTLLR